MRETRYLLVNGFLGDTGNNVTWFKTKTIFKKYIYKQTIYSTEYSLSIRLSARFFF
jgi:hypothetical protein